jgi:hypothetical protein
MKATFHRRTITFVVRLWGEYLDQATPSWRGEIQRLDSGERAHFQHLVQILAFIKHSISPASAAEYPQDKE